MNARVFAPAKINLTLEVDRARADGLHPLQSAVMFADVGDWVEAEPASRLSLSLSGPFAAGLAADESNLVLRAARALAMAGSVDDRGAALHLRKELPIASGIGGGSADAAATLKALNALWGLDLAQETLCEIARALGADVPVCVAARPAYMTGVGDAFVPLAAPELSAVLINPGVALATPAVYAQFDVMQLGGGFIPAPAPVWRDAGQAFADVVARGNHLDAPARALAPVLGDIAARLRGDDRVCCFGLSGSGATMFALVDDMSVACSLADALQQERPPWWVRAAQLSGA